MVQHNLWCRNYGAPLFMAPKFMVHHGEYLRLFEFRCDIAAWRQKFYLFFDTLVFICSALQYAVHCLKTLACGSKIIRFGPVVLVLLVSFRFLSRAFETGAWSPKARSHQCPRTGVLPRPPRADREALEERRISFSTCEFHWFPLFSQRHSNAP